MSHVVSIQTLITDLDALRQAVAELGCTWHQGVKEYRWWGRSAGDYPIPAGFKAEDLGKCEHMIAVPGAEFQIGVVRRRDGKPGWTLLYDFYGRRGQPIHDHLGEGLKKLSQRYTVCKTERELRKLGANTHRLTLASGKVAVVGGLA
jgi:hypothetical protein